MRTVSARYEKGKEPHRGWFDGLRLLLSILSLGWARVWRGRKIRRRFHRCKREQRKVYLEDIDLP